MTAQILLKEKGFMLNGTFSPSYDLRVMEKNMQMRLELIRGLNPARESVFNSFNIAGKQNQRQN